MNTSLGRVAAPPDCESTTGEFYFWVAEGQSVERTQIVRTACTIGERDVLFIGFVQEVYRRSRQADIGEESDRYDGGRGGKPPFDSFGITYAKVAVLRTHPVTHAPPLEESEVCLATPDEARLGYGVDRTEHPLDVGLLRNGGTAFAGKATLDLDYLLGENGGHLNVNGIAGLGAKSSFLLHVVMMLLREAKRQQIAAPSGSDNLQLAPIVFNVKNYDHFFIDQWNRKYDRNKAENDVDWRELGVDDPQPFTAVKFLAPQVKGLSTPANVGRHDTSVKPYSWSLADVIAHGLFRFLFADDAIYDPNFGGYVDELEEFLTDDYGGTPKLKATGVPQTFNDLLKEFKELTIYKSSDYAPQTRGKVFRHLKYIVRGGEGVLRRDDVGNPIRIPNAAFDGPLVIDLFSIRMTPHLQRFVVAAVFHQLVELRSKHAVPGLRFAVVLDELNRFAPKESSDPITAIIETVAAEMRSQGVILLGAQQQASLVKPRVIANCAVKAIGRSDSLEMSAEVWKALDRSARQTAAQLQAEEKLLVQPNFREPMLAKIPFPPFALKREDGVLPTGAASVPAWKKNLIEDL
ncbi:ATP-binding protein [soil metagenome]